MADTLIPTPVHMENVNTALRHSGKLSSHTGEGPRLLSLPVPAEGGGGSGELRGARGQAGAVPVGAVTTHVQPVPSPCTDPTPALRPALPSPPVN